MHGADLINLLKPCKGASLRVIQATGSIQSVLQSYIKKKCYLLSEHDTHHPDTWFCSFDEKITKLVGVQLLNCYFYGA